MDKNKKILITGANGLVGSSLKRTLIDHGHEKILSPTRKELNLLDEQSVLNYFKENRPSYVINAAAKVGGIYANNTFRADFIFQNLNMQNNIFKSCFEYQVEKLLFLGSSCIYPKNCPQPIKEEYLLQSELEKTNEPYAIAKIAGLKTAESFKEQYGCNYFSVMPTNLYGVNDNFHEKNAHVIPSLINRMYETIQTGKTEFEVWGTGSPKREFLYVDDMADACIFLLNYKGDLPHWINIGTGLDISIKELAETIATIMNFKGKIVFNTNYPDGTPRKLLDVSKINNLGWKAKIGLKEGLEKTIKYYAEAAKNNSLRKI